MTNALCKYSDIFWIAACLLFWDYRYIMIATDLVLFFCYDTKFSMLLSLKYLSYCVLGPYLILQLFEFGLRHWDLRTEQIYHIVYLQFYLILLRITNNEFGYLYTYPYLFGGYNNQKQCVWNRYFSEKHY